MPIRLHCDCPGCNRSINAPLSTGTYRFDLRDADGWWLVAGRTGSVTACCADHLNAALGEPNAAASDVY
jgi:hypothetical protein